MAIAKKIGIWMDHSEANLITFKKEASDIVNIENTFDHEEMEAALNKSEHLMHNKRQQHMAAYYKQIGDSMLSYNEVVLFGPTNAKTELKNILNADLRFENVKINIQGADKMTENQKIAFVNTYFEK